jgi:hypothetical protein
MNSPGTPGSSGQVENNRPGQGKVSEPPVRSARRLKPVCFKRAAFAVNVMRVARTPGVATAFLEPDKRSRLKDTSRGLKQVMEPENSMQAGQPAR